MYSFLFGPLNFSGLCLQNEGPVALYIIQKGKVRITFDPDSIRSPSMGSLASDNQRQDDDTESSTECLVKTEGSYFGEWALLGENIGSFSAVAMGDVVCTLLTKEKFDAVVGPLAKLSQDDEKYDLISCKECSFLDLRGHLQNQIIEITFCESRIVLWLSKVMASYQLL